LEKIALNPSNLDLFTRSARYYYQMGGRYSGKTYDSIQMIIYRLLAVPNSRACFMRKHYANLKETLYSDALEICRSTGIEAKFLKSPLEIHFKNGSEIIFKGADESEKLKGLSSIDMVLMDELNEFTETDFQTIDSSIRGKHQENAIYLCHNPVPKVPGGLYWFEALFRMEKEPGKIAYYYDENLGSYVSTVRSTYKQNLKCPDHVKRRLEGYKQTNPSLYKLWALGEYTEVQGVIFDNWDVVESVPDNIECLGFGLDFGFAADPAACVKVWANSEEMWIKGICYNTSLTNSDLYGILTSKGVDRYDYIIADSAEPKSIEDLSRLGFGNIRGAKKRANYKTDMVNALKSYRIHLIEGDIDLQREFSTWAWMTDKTGRQIPKPQDGNDHYIDAFIMLTHDKIGQSGVALW
jgi:phage terminase large subunit